MVCAHLCMCATVHKVHLKINKPTSQKNKKQQQQPGEQMIVSIEDVTKRKGPGDGARGQLRTAVTAKCFSSSCKEDIWRATISSRTKELC